ncbi:structural maintenance of chromosomes protein 3-like isoform X2 [Symsagittifera roscoffensis]|uniref:structural maintenance of chromosomes protein 3-like isoform X2 n=1 Tax=Symsagittifera roscoffensis TaxID=84072 RepID=UPI00307C27D9
MHIKQVIIDGFRSYKDQTKIEPFSKRANVFVGLTGSGKSDIVYAIEFVLADDFSNLRAEQRLALLHEGTGQRITTANVEIIFDNRDNRLPIEQEEVSLQRVIGAKKDEFFMDKKSIPKNEVLSLLEAAGFSRSKPYYIVKQSEINEIATAPDLQRLKRIQEIAGIKVLDERREELKQCQKWDKSRRMLEYTIQDNELKKRKQNLEDLSKKRDEISSASLPLQDKLQEILKRGKQIGKDMGDLKNKISSIVDEKDTLLKEKSDLIEQKAKLELTAKDLQDKVDNEESMKEILQSELKTVNDQITEKQEKFTQFASQLEEVNGKEGILSFRLNCLDQHAKFLNAKEPLVPQFEYKEQRDKWLGQEINELKLVGGNLQEQIQSLNSHLENDRSDRIELESQITSLNQNLDEAEQQINHALSEIERAKTKACKHQEMTERLKADLRLKNELLNSIQKSYKAKKRPLKRLQLTLDQVNASMNSYRVEMETELLPQIIAQHQIEVGIIANEKKKVMSELKAIGSERSELEEKRKMIFEYELGNTLKRKQEYLVNQLQDLGSAKKKRKLENDLSLMAERFEAIKPRLDEIDTQLDNLNLDLQNLQENFEENKNQEKEIQDKIEGKTKYLETITKKQHLIVKRIEDCSKKIRDLGSLANESFGNYQEMNRNQLIEELHKCNNELEKYIHVNEKALQQFVSTTEEKKSLHRKAEVDRGSQAIQDMMDSLDNQRYEAIECTFKQVSKYFSEVFQKLVPGGQAQLVMRRKEADSQEGGSQQPELPSVEQFSGVSIKVSFSGKPAETREMSQLLGGQKSLVALTFIFAIQKCDPAPFYLFEEIDAALDPEHRQSLANMIKELSNNAQFIITTFSPELSEAADKFYGVKSHVQTIGKKKIAKLVGVVSTSRAAPFQILIEYLSMGNLNSFLRQKQRDNESLSLYRLHSFSQQIWNGMNHLSEGLIVHRDLATRNCLLANAVTVKLGDFGFAEQLESLDDFIQVNDDSDLPLRWLPPGMLSEVKYCLNQMSGSSE